MTGAAAAVGALTDIAGEKHDRPCLLATGILSRGATMLVAMSGVALATSGVRNPGADDNQHPAITSELIVVGQIVAEEIYKPPPVVGWHDGRQLQTAVPSRVRATVQVEEVLKGDRSLTEVVLSATVGYFPGIQKERTMLLHLIPQPDGQSWSLDGTYYSIYHRVETPCGVVAVRGDGSLVADYPSDVATPPTFFTAPSVVSPDTIPPTTGIPTAGEYCGSVAWDVLVANARTAGATATAEQR